MSVMHCRVIDYVISGVIECLMPLFCFLFCFCFFSRPYPTNAAGSTIISFTCVCVCVCLMRDVCVCVCRYFINLVYYFHKIQSSSQCPVCV